LETNIKTYEAMFLVDSALAASDWNDVIGAITNIMERIGAEVLSLRKWDERRLAYPIEKKERGTYILCYFKVDSQKITQIEREVQLSEKLMRALILTADHLTAEDMEKETPAMVVERGNRPPEVPEPAQVDAGDEINERIEEQEIPAIEELEEEK